MKDLEILQERNQQYINGFDGSDLPIRPRFFTAIICCIDARVDPTHFLGLQPGEALVIRNAGGRITPEVIKELAILWAIAKRMTDGKGPNLSVAIVQHGDCGMERMALPEVRQGFHQATGLSLEELEKMAIHDHDRDMEADIELLRQSSLIPDELVVSGHFYDVKTGEMKQMIEPTSLLGEVAS